VHGLRTNHISKNLKPASLCATVEFAYTTRASRFLFLASLLLCPPHRHHSPSSFREKLYH
jgi:hypothetical protein